MTRAVLLLVLALAVGLVACDFPAVHLDSVSSIPGLSGMRVNLFTQGIFVSGASALTNQIYTINPLTGEAVVVAGSGKKGNADGPAMQAEFNNPTGIEFVPMGRELTTMLIADTGNHAIRMLSHGTVTTLTSNLTAPTELSLGVRANLGGSVAIGVYVGDGDDVLFMSVTPSNDDCTGAVDLGTLSSNPIIITGTNRFASMDTVGCMDDDDDYRYPRSGVWYTFVGNGEPAVITTCNGYTDIDTMIFVFRADELNTEQCDAARLQCIDFNDDDWNCRQDDEMSTVEMCTQANMRYYVVVSGYSSHEYGEFMLTVSEASSSTCSSCGCPSSYECGGGTCGYLCPQQGDCSGDQVCADHQCVKQPANVQCSGAISIAAGTNVTGDTRAVMVPMQVPPLSATCHSGGDGLWYKAIGGGYTMRVSTCSQATTVDDTILQVFVPRAADGSCESGLRCIDHNDDDWDCNVNDYLSTVEFCGDAGQTYYIFASGYSNSNKGLIDVSVSEDTNFPCRVFAKANDDVSQLVIPAGHHVIHPPLVVGGGGGGGDARRSTQLQKQGGRKRLPEKAESKAKAKRKREGGGGKKHAGGGKH